MILMVHPCKFWKEIGIPESEAGEGDGAGCILMDWVLAAE